MGKATTVTAAVASRLLPVAVGAQIPTTAALARDLGVGYGTVHAALRALQAGGVVELSTHGHQGTRLVRRDLIALWQASSRGSLVGVLPLPQSLEFSGLATAVAAVADKADLPLQLTFRQGSEQRFALLREGRVDWVLASGAAAAREREWSDAVLLPDHTYYSHGSVVVATAAGRTPDPRGRIAIDRGSHDHTILTRAEFPRGTYVDAAYWSIPDMLVHGEADAAVWHRTSSSPLLTAVGLSIHPLRNASPDDAIEINRAALVCRAEDAAVRAVLDAIFESDELAALQGRVMTRQVAPAF